MRDTQRGHAESCWCRSLLVSYFTDDLRAHIKHTATEDGRTMSQEGS